MTPGVLTVRAHAKINLSLEVLGKREDGYHEIASILQTIDLHDRLQFRSHDELQLVEHGRAVLGDNLILRAARLLQEQTGRRDGGVIDCWKRIPVAAGLGGGSADAAATLLGLNDLWNLSLGLDELCALGATLGADIPFFVRGGTALVTGTGTAMEQLPDAPEHWVLLVPIESHDAAKTASMYARLSSTDFSDGRRVHRQASGIERGTLPYDCVGSAFDRLADSVAFDALRALRRTRARAAGLTGAGPSAFALFGSRAEARADCIHVSAHTTLHQFVGRRPTAP